MEDVFLQRGLLMGVIIMGLIKAAAGTIGSTFHDQWKEAIRCEEMGNDR